MMTVAIQGLHGLAAMMTQTPEMSVNNEEAETIAKPLTHLMAHYSIVPPPEVVLWTNFLTAVAYVEAPRIMLIRMRKAEEKRANMKSVYDSKKPPQADVGAGDFMGAPGSGMAN